MKKSLAVLTLALGLASHVAQAFPTWGIEIDTKYHTLSGWEWAPLSETETLQEFEKSLALQQDIDTESEDFDLPGFRSLVSMDDLKALWVIGEKVYRVVEQGKPVLNINTQTWSVLPRGVQKANELTEWKEPVRLAYELKAKNLYGIEVINVRYIVQFVPGGKHQEKGAFLSHIAVIPSTVEVAWGYTLNINAEAREALNVGTLQNPVAAFSTDVRVEVKTLLKHGVSTLTTFMTGEGKILPAGFSNYELQ